MIRRMMMGVVAVVIACGAAAGKPPGLPIDPLSEGRELDPVTRDFHLPAPPAAGPIAQEAVAGTPAESGAYLTIWSIFAGLHDALLNRLTVPLGTVPMDGGR
jgi:hypothetical protein